ncbi:hypothetical protein AB0O28_37290 [Microbispora sp. NPDC088329]|uniref:ATP-binding protein n=1 Tax=Microbispora sp. NPDC088329 TaxID=3154869 RepID=UPI003436E2A8
MFAVVLLGGLGMREFLVPHADPLCLPLALYALATRSRAVVPLLVAAAVAVQGVVELPLTAVVRDQLGLVLAILVAAWAAGTAVRQRRLSCTRPGDCSGCCVRTATPGSPPPPGWPISARSSSGPGRRAWRWLKTGVTVEITDDGTRGQARPYGHGLTGLRERVRVFGGEFEAGARPVRGFRVMARLPL